MLSEDSRSARLKSCSVCGAVGIQDDRAFALALGCRSRSGTISAAGGRGDVRPSGSTV